MSLTHLYRRVLHRRAGSVLILVVALLLLMAVIGTAFISGSRLDRYAAVQHTTNTQADLLLQGVVSAVNASVIDSLNGTTTAKNAALITGYRPASQEMTLPNPVADGSGGGATYSYQNYDGVGTATVYDPGATVYPAVLAQAVDLFLGARTPVAPDVVPAGLAVAWPSVSWPVFPTVTPQTAPTPATVTYSFDSPFKGDTSLNLVATNRAVIQSYVGYKTESDGNTYPGLIYYIPSGSRVYADSNDTVGTITATDEYITPAGVYNVAPTPATYNTYATLAADADGDGIADAPLQRLPVGQIDGVTYYAAIRVVDSNSAVNASTAWEAVGDPFGQQIQQSGTNVNFGFFRSNVGLYELLNPSPGGTKPSSLNELDALNQYRFNGTEAAPTSSTVTPSLNIATAYDDSAAQRPDFQFASYGDMLDSQLARRSSNPGYNTAAVKFSWLGRSETAAMAYRGCLLNPSPIKSIIETVLPNETYTFSGYASTPFQPTMVSGAGNDWFETQYRIGANSTSYPTATMPEPVSLRPLLVGSSPVANAAPSRFGNTQNIPTYLGTATYQFGDMVKGTDGYTYASLCVNNNTAKLSTGLALPISNGVVTLANNNPVNSIGQASPPVYENPFWARVPWSTTPLRASANTATFEQLWVAFCHVMTDSVTPINGISVLSPPQWNPPYQTASALASVPQLTMFRSSVRDNRALPNLGYNLSPMHMMQLRAALAAVNTIELRAGGEDVTSRHITLNDQGTGVPLFDVEVYGATKQPYISEVLADVQSNTDYTKNYLAIELVNPYPTPIIVSKHWKFAYMARPTTSGVGAPSLTVTNIGSLAADLIIPPAQSNKPGRGYILGNAANAPSGFVASIPTGPTITIRTNGQTSITGTNVATLAGLEQALGNELVILKPRLADTPTRENATNISVYPNADVSISTDPNDSFDELNNPADMVPVDQIDFTGTANAATGEPVPYRLHYRRADDPTLGYAWNCVYPGPYYPTADGTIAPTTHATTSADSTYTFRQAFQYEPEASATIGSFTLPKSGAPAIAGATPTYFTVPLQMANAFMGGVNPTTAEVPTASGVVGQDFTYQTTAPNIYPYGGFARNGDLQQIPFIGAYRIRPFANAGVLSESAVVTEMNSVVMDSACAWDNTLPSGSTFFQSNVVTGLHEQAPNGATVSLPPLNSASSTVTAVGSTGYEQIGRFCLIGDSGADAAGLNPTTEATRVLVTGVQTLDYVDLSPTNEAAPANWHYHWAKRLFDYLTIQAPADDYFPNVDPRPNVRLSRNPLELAPYAPYQGVPNTYVSLATAQPEAVANRKPGVANETATTSEETVPVDGLININTAPLSVLSTLPFVPRGIDNLSYAAPTGASSVGKVSVAANEIDDNADIAHAIVAYRNVFGPFKSIQDLYRVPAFALENQLMIQVNEPTANNGYFIADRPLPLTGWAPATQLGSDSPRADFAEKGLLLDRISNLITTRSDSFTCYVLLQGWRNVGSSAPTLVVQRRAAFILDRSPVTPTNPAAFTTFPISQN